MSKTELTAKEKKAKDQLDHLMRQIPEVLPSEKVILPLQFFKNLSDSQIKKLTTEVEMDIHVGKKTARYIYMRLREMGIEPRKYITNESDKE